MRPVFLTIPAVTSLLVVLGISSVNAADPRLDPFNLMSCRHGLPTCRVELLDERQRLEIEARAGSENLRACFYGTSACRRHSLTGEERRIVIRAEELERREAREARRDNQRRCAAGSPLCDRTALPLWQQQELEGDSQRRWMRLFNSARP